MRPSLYVAVFILWLQWLRCEYNALVDVLEPIIDVKMKEKLATVLVAVFHHEGLIQNFLADILVTEINKLGMLLQCSVLYYS